MVYAFVLFFAGFLAFVVPASVRRWFRRRRKNRDTTTRCRCGYEMDQLDTIRCPECGRVSGFDATAEELELTPDQLQQAKAKRDARRLDDANTSGR